MAFPTGFMANTGTITALAYVPFFARMADLPLRTKTPGMVVVSDALNHASIVEGLQAARAQHAYYEHCDLDSLSEKLDQHRGKRVWSSPTGSSAWTAICAATRHTGVGRPTWRNRPCRPRTCDRCAGCHGSGDARHFGLEGGEVLQMGTYSKSFGALGGFAATDRQTAEVSAGRRPLVYVLRRDAGVPCRRDSQSHGDRRA